LGGSVPDRFPGDITTSLKVRVSGARLKHLIQGNSLKAYGKAHTPVGDIFRVETMTSNGAVFSIYRAVEAGPADQLRRRSAAVSRKLRLLRAHGLIQKVPKTHRYQVTETGRLAIAAILTMQQASMGRSQPCRVKSSQPQRN